MKVHLDELELATAYARSHASEGLSPRQIQQIRDRGRELYRWFKAHGRMHAAIGALVILSLVAGDWFVLIQLPHFVITPGRSGSVVLAAILTGMAHSWILYSMAIYSLHEAAAHNLVFPGRGPLSRAGAFLAKNLCRVGAAEPTYYATCHMGHHAAFGTERDSEFLNFVLPGRFWRMLLPLASFINFSDFVIHRPLTYTRGRIISGIAGITYNGVYAYFLWKLFGPSFTVITLLLMPHFGFYIDRMRQFTEHNLMPLQNNSGARNFGMGFWGLFIGGGPWGQPCHMAHHLVATIPWYQQILLHRYIVGVLTETQKRQFILKPIIGFPVLLVRVVIETGRFSRQSQGEAGKPADGNAAGNPI